MKPNIYLATCSVTGSILKDVIRANPTLTPFEVATRAWNIARNAVEIAEREGDKIDGGLSAVAASASKGLPS